MSQLYFLRLPAVLQRVGIGKSTFYKLIKEGKFSAPVKLGPRAVGWLSTDVDQFIAARIHASRQQVSHD